jgi:DNA-directed RNA polymerase specialized sigma24 family protein
MGFDEAAAELARAIDAGVEPQDGAWKCVVESISRLLSSWFSTRLSPSDRSDVVSEAVKDFVQAIRNGRYEPQRSAAAYLTAIAQNAGKDRLAQLGRVVAVDPVPLDAGGIVGAAQEGSLDLGDMAAELLDRVDSVETIARAMARAMEAGDHGCNAAVQVWLSMSEMEGRRISTREVATKMRISHTEVGRRLSRFRTYLDEGSSGSAPEP